MTADWLNERPEPILAQTMATEAGIARREAADDPHPLDCRCRDCADHEPLDSLLPYFGAEDEDGWDVA